MSRVSVSRKIEEMGRRSLDGLMRRRVEEICRARPLLRSRSLISISGVARTAKAGIPIEPYKSLKLGKEKVINIFGQSVPDPHAQSVE